MDLLLVGTFEQTMSDPNYPRVIYIWQFEPGGELDVTTEGWALWETLAALDEAENQITASDAETAETEGDSA